MSRNVKIESKIQEFLSLNYEDNYEYRQRHQFQVVPWFTCLLFSCIWLRLSGSVVLWFSCPLVQIGLVLVHGSVVCGSAVRGLVVT